MLRMPLVGGNWNNGANAGIAALNLNNRRGNANTNIGFRPALLLCQMPGVHGRLDGAKKKRSRIPSRERENINSRARPVGPAEGRRAALFNTMKTVNNIFDSVIDFDNLYEAYKAASCGKRYRRAQLEFTANLEENLITIQNEIIWGMWKPLPLREFWINDPKKRLISAPAYRDRIVHHALVQVIDPIFDRKFIHDSHACRVGHGTHYAVHRLQWFTRRAQRAWGEYYVYKGDIKSFFPSIHHETLKKIVRRTISDRRILALIDLIIDGYRDGSRGLPIGALTSQLFANAYLDPLDHFAKEQLGIRFYMRYMDDFVCIVQNKSEARSVAYSLEQYIRDGLLLEINPKSGIHHGKNGIAFCGFRIWPTHILPRRSTMRRATRRLRKLSNTATAARFRASVMSFIGYFKHFSAHRSMQSILYRLIIKGGSK